MGNIRDISINHQGKIRTVHLAEDDTRTWRQVSMGEAFEGLFL